MISIPIHWLSLKNLFALMLTGYLSVIVSSCAVPNCPSSVEENRQTFGVSQTQGCRVYNPLSEPIEEHPFVERAETKTAEGVKVTAAVLSDKESKQIFSLDLAKHDIQPVWLKIKNNTDQLVAFLLVALDPGYFFPNEAAHMNRTPYDSLNEMITENLNKHRIDRDIPAGGEKSGFIYTRRDPGIKYLNVMLYGPKNKQTFVYYFEIPGIRTDYQRVDFDAIYSKDEFIDLKNEDELRAALEKIPCCTTKKDGSGENDPLNFIIIGNRDDISSAFMRRGWDVTEPIYIGSGWRAFKAFFSHVRYRTSPMSSLYFYKRRQDIGLQKARSTIHERNHLRLWLTPFRFKGKHLWIGAISRDTGFYFTTKTPWLIDHAIDPDLDEARAYLVQDLLFSQGVSKFGYVQYTRPTTRKDPRWNFMEQPWWSDGRRAVFLFDTEPTPLTKLELIPWEWSEHEELINEAIRRTK
ncbi:LssY C-terminal domain-containing protein [Desulfobacterota bacterium AH_259_B03_O07]|nr:LssY C-terminal domain-containing protein [Desulfobacterota bacterium AH_259_B03_O07]